MHSARAHPERAPRSLLFVADDANNRVMIYATPVSNDKAAANEFGQPSGTAFTSLRPCHERVRALPPDRRRHRFHKSETLCGWADYYAAEGARFIRSLDVQMNSISDEDAVFVEPPDNAEADRTRVIPGDVLLTITGSKIGRVATVPDRLNGAYISQHVAILRLKAGLLPEFLSMFLSLESGGQQQIARSQYGQTKPGLNLDQIREMRVPLPQVNDQQKFLEILRRTNRLRAANQEALRQAEHLFVTLLHRAFN